MIGYGTLCRLQLWWKHLIICIHTNDKVFIYRCVNTSDSIAYWHYLTLLIEYTIFSFISEVVWNKERITKCPVEAPATVTTSEYLRNDHRHCSLLWPLSYFTKNRSSVSKKINNLFFKMYEKKAGKVIHSPWLWIGLDSKWDNTTNKIRETLKYNTNDDCITYKQYNKITGVKCPSAYVFLLLIDQ